MSAKIHIERMLHRNSISVPGDSVASYALIKLIPAGDSAQAPSLNLALALDVSGSMYEEDGTGMSRLQRIQEAAVGGLRRLKPEDTLAVIAFAQDAKVLLSPTSVSDKTKIEEIVGKIDRFDIDPGGTAMDQGLALAIGEVEKHMGDDRLSRVLVLTDGETSGEQTCRELAQQAAVKKIQLALMGVGTEWNATLMKDLAKLSEGRWYYIDVTQVQEAERVFLEEFERLASTGFTNVEMHLRPVKDVKVKRVRQVVPEIKELHLTEVAERHWRAALGTLERDRSTRYLLDLSLPKRPDGKYVILQFEVRYQPGGSPAETTGLVPLEISYAASTVSPINAEAAKYIDEVQIFELNGNLQQAIAGNNQAEAQRLAENISKKGELMGARAAKKTMLAKQVLQELNAGGRVSRKTQLAVDDAARLAAETPESSVVSHP